MNFPFFSHFFNEKESEDLLLTFTNLNADAILILNNQKNPENTKPNIIGSKYVISQNNENSSYFLNVPNKEIKTFKEEELWQKLLKYFFKTQHQCTEMELADTYSQNKPFINENSSVLDCESEETAKPNHIFQCHYNLHKK